MRSVESLIRELQRFPPGSQCYAYEGEIRGVVVVSREERTEIGWVVADETPADADVETIIHGARR